MEAGRWRGIGVDRYGIPLFRRYRLLLFTGLSVSMPWFGHSKIGGFGISSYVHSMAFVGCVDDGILALLATEFIVY
jgi:hypothetical protein